jgi:hypothetical protein
MMKIVKGKKAETAKGMRHNIEAMKLEGKSTKRARGTAYGEVGLAKRASRDESKGMKKAMAKKSTKKKC